MLITFFSVLIKMDYRIFVGSNMTLIFKYSTGIRKVDTRHRPFGGQPQVKRRFYRHQEAFVIAGIPDFCSALLFVNRLQDNKSRK